MAKRRRRAGNRVFPKRSGLWIPFEVTTALITAGGEVESGDILANYFGQTGAEVPTGATVGPIRGEWQLIPTIVSALDVTMRVEAVLQLNREGGRATLPVPGVDIMDAMWYGQFFYNEQFREISAGVFQGIGVSKPFVTKSMRKITGNGQTLTFTATPSSNTDYTVRWLGNAFLKLP